MTTFRAASFFSGIGGLDLAFAWSGFDIVYQCEIDDYCQRVLKKWRSTYWPNARLGKDIRDVKGSDVGEVDVIFGGFPCQDISVAGKQAGIHVGTRSGLWFELVRIIGEVRPRVVMLENVAAILTNGGSTVIASLAEIGYNAQWTLIRASDVGAPHRRERWFCVAYDNRKRRTARRNYRGKRYLQNHVNRVATKDQSKRHGRKCRIRPVGENVPYANISNGRQRHCRSSIATSTSQSSRLPRCPIRRARDSGRSRKGNARSRAYSLGCSEASTRSTTQAHTTTQSRLGRRSHGASSRVHRHRRISTADHHAQRWPARPNGDQYSYEPSRVTERTDHRNDRLKGLGNAVVPQQALPIVQAVKEFLEDIE